MTDAAMDKSSRPEATIEISLGKLQQLFNSFDPRPRSRSRCRRIFVGWAEETAMQLPLKRSFICRRASYADQPRSGACHT